MKRLEKYDSQDASKQEHSSKLQAQFDMVSSELNTVRTENADLKKEQMGFEVTKSKLQQEVIRAETQLKATIAMMGVQRTACGALLQPNWLLGRWYPHRVPACARLVPALACVSRRHGGSHSQVT